MRQDIRRTQCILTEAELERLMRIEKMKRILR